MKATIIVIFVFQSALAVNAVQSVNMKQVRKDASSAASTVVNPVDKKVSVSFSSDGGLKADHHEDDKTAKISLKTLKRITQELDNRVTDEDESFSLEELEAMSFAKSLDKKNWVANANEGAIHQTGHGQHKCLSIATTDNGGTEVSTLTLVTCDAHSLFNQNESIFKKTTNQLKLKFRELCLQGEPDPENAHRGHVYARSCCHVTDTVCYDYQKWVVDHANHQVKLHGTNLCAEAKLGEATVSLATCNGHADQKFQMRNTDFSER